MSTCVGKITSGKMSIDEGRLFDSPEMSICLNLYTNESSAMTVWYDPDIGMKVVHFYQYYPLPLHIHLWVAWVGQQMANQSDHYYLMIVNFEQDNHSFHLQFQ